MALFKRKDKFPKYIDTSSGMLNLPKYESQISDEKYDEPENLKLPIMPKALVRIERPKISTNFEELADHYDDKYPEDLNLNMPIRSPGKFELRNPLEESKPIIKEPIVKEQPRFVPERIHEPITEPTGEPIYVKLEDYKKAVKSIALIKEKLEETEDLLVDLTDLKQEEDQQLNQWTKEVADIKSMLMEIYKDLFEVGR